MVQSRRYICKRAMVSEDFQGLCFLCAFSPWWVNVAKSLQVSARTIRQVYTQTKRVQFQTRRAARNLIWRFLNQSSAFVNEKQCYKIRTTHKRTDIVLFRWVCSERWRRTFCSQGNDSFRRFSRIMERYHCYFHWESCQLSK